MSQTFSKVSIGCLIAVAILFFLPWYTTNVEAELFANESIISGSTLAKYASDVTASSLLDMVPAGWLRVLIGGYLGLTRLMYVLPLLAVGAAVMRYFRVRFHRGVAVAAFAGYIAMVLPLLILPALEKELASLMQALFVTTPSMILIVIASVVGLFTTLAPTPPEQPKSKGTR